MIDLSYDIVNSMITFKKMNDNRLGNRSLIIAVFVILTSCVRTEMPEVSTMLVDNITAISAECGGKILSDGGEDIIACGICWATVPYPTVKDSIEISHPINSEFGSIMSILTPGKTYHVRAFAININGTVYGEDVEFLTSGNPYCIAVTEGESFYGDIFTSSLPTIVTFEFGKSNGYDTSIPIDGPIVGNVLIRVGFEYLDANSFGHFRVKGENAAGVFYSQGIELPCGCRSPMPSDGW